VSLVPDALAREEPRVRRCVQDAADARPPARGAVELEQGGRGLVASGGDAALGRCFAAALEAPMRAAGITRARVEYGPH
jgi:hypothetical protein